MKDWISALAYAIGAVIGIGFFTASGMYLLYHAVDSDKPVVEAKPANFRGVKK